MAKKPEEEDEKQAQNKTKAKKTKKKHTKPKNNEPDTERYGERKGNRTQVNNMNKVMKQWEQMN